ncbi:MAG: hypothetical protein IAF38_22225 [Bacteroidia bacterium]|nr:hypothetical protein [Bacteroidia bacterium]
MQNNYISIIFEYVPITVALLLVCIGMLRFKTLTRELRVLFLFSILAFASDLCSLILGKYGINNLFVFHVFTPAEFILLSAVYYFKSEKKGVKIALIIVSILFLILAFVDSFFFELLSSVDSISSATESLVLMLYSLFFFYSLLKKLEYKNLFDNPMFWFNSGVLIYFSGNFFLFIFSNYMLGFSDVYFDRMWHIHDILNVAMNILFGLALWKR